MTHFEQAVTQDGRLVPYQWLVFEPTAPAPGCDEAFRVVAECSSKRDAERITNALNAAEGEK